MDVYPTKYQVGDTVVIREDIEVGKYYPMEYDNRSIYFNKEMAHCKGVLAKITKICCNAGKGSYCYKLDIDRGAWMWSDGMFEARSAELNDFLIDDSEFNSFINSLFKTGGE